MKFLKLKKLTLNNDTKDFIFAVLARIGINTDKNATLNYKSFLIQMLNESSEGMSLEEMRRAMETIHKLQEIPDSGWLALENSEHEQITAKLNKIRWARGDDALIEFADDVLNAPSKEPDEYTAWMATQRNSKKKAA